MDEFCNLANNNKDFTFVIKTKKPTLTSSLLDSMNKNQKNITNLKVDDSFDIFEITEKLRIVILLLLLSYWRQCVEVAFGYSNVE